MGFNIIIVISEMGRRLKEVVVARHSLRQLRNIHNVSETGVLGVMVPTEIGLSRCRDQNFLTGPTEYRIFLSLTQNNGNGSSFQNIVYTKYTPGSEKCPA
jgi:hypothetical protein